MASQSVLTCNIINIQGSDKIVRSNHRKNPVRDGDFLNDFSDMIEHQGSWVAGDTIVGRSSTPIPLNKAFDFTWTAGVPSNSLASSTSAHSRWVHRPLTTARMARIVRKSVNLPRSHEDLRPQVPSQWRDLSDVVKMVFYHFSIRARGTSYRFDLNLSADIEKKALAQGSGACSFIHRQIANALKAALKRPVEFVMVLEENEKRRLHVHGTMSVEEDFRLTARNALKKAGGEWDGNGGPFQVSMRPAQKDPDLRGATYSSKYAQWATPARRTLMKKFNAPNLVPGFRGRAISPTQGIRRDAEMLYEQARAMVIDYRKTR